MSRKELKPQMGGPITGYNVDVDGKNYPMSVSGDGSNCKLSYIHSIGSIWNYTNKEESIVKAIKEVLYYLKGAVIINTTNQRISDMIFKNFDTYYYHKVPIGYNNGYQYHICIKNSTSISSYCRKPENNTDLTGNPVNVSLKDDNDLNILASKLKEELKKRRRKTDFVDELIESLKNNE